MHAHIHIIYIASEINECSNIVRTNAYEALHMLYMFLTYIAYACFFFTQRSSDDFVVCMHVCVHAYIHTYIYMYIYIQIIKIVCDVFHYNRGDATCIIQS